MAVDKQAVSELLALSAYALDHKDLDTLQGCFTADANFTLVIDGVAEPSVFSGRDEIMTLMKGALDVQTDMRRHVVSNIWYAQTADDAATVVSYLTLAATEDGQTRVITTGVYTDQVARQADGRWLLSDRHLLLDRPY